MTVIRSIVVGDTNFYRSCSDEEMQALVALEARARVVPMATYLVCSELLPHAATDRSPDAGSCRAAVGRLYDHCFAMRTSEPASRFVPDPHALLALSIFRRPLPDQTMLAQNFAAMVSDIGNGRAPDLVPGLKDVLVIVERHRDKLETRFVGMLNNLRRQAGLDPNAESDFPENQRPTPREFALGPEMPLVGAGALVVNVAAECGISVTDEEVDKLGAELLSRIPTAIDFLVQVIASVLVDGAAPAKHANSLWDTHFATLASEWLRCEGVPLLLVTDDKRVLRAARRTRADGRVLSPSSYRSYLESAA